VKLARDPSALLRGGKPALALRVPLGPQRSLLQVCDPLAALSHPVADHPGAAPDDSAEEQRHDGELVCRDSGGCNVGDEEAGDGDRRQPQTRSRLGRSEGEEEQRYRRPERRALRVAQPVQRHACRGREREHAERCSAPNDERQR